MPIRHHVYITKVVQNGYRCLTRSFDLTTDADKIFHVQININIVQSPTLHADSFKIATVFFSHSTSEMYQFFIHDIQFEKLAILPHDFTSTISQFFICYSVQTQVVLLGDFTSAYFQIFIQVIQFENEVLLHGTSLAPEPS